MRKESQLVVPTQWMWMNSHYYFISGTFRSNYKKHLTHKPFSLCPWLGMEQVTQAQSRCALAMKMQTSPNHCHSKNNIITCLNWLSLSLTSRCEVLKTNYQRKRCWSIILPTQSDLERLVALSTPKCFKCYSSMFVLVHSTEIERPTMARCQNMQCEGTTGHIINTDKGVNRLLFTRLRLSSQDWLICMAACTSLCV